MPYPGDRILVAAIVGMVAEGMTDEEILSDYPQLSTENTAKSCGWPQRRG